MTSVTFRNPTDLCPNLRTPTRRWRRSESQRKANALSSSSGVNMATATPDEGCLVTRWRTHTFTAGGCVAVRRGLRIAGSGFQSCRRGHLSPPMVGVGKPLTLTVGEGPRRRIPDEMFNGDRVAVDAQKVECVRFTPHSRGDCGARLDDQRRPSADVVALCRRSSERDVHVTGEKHVNAFAGKLLDRLRTWARASE